MNTHTPLSVIVPAGNRIEVIEDCLRSVRWADELIVVDSFSTDGSLDIASRYADRILQHAYGFSAQQKNWAIPQATHSWVFIVDTDERVTQELRLEIDKVLSNPDPYKGFKIPRVNLFNGKQMMYGGYYPDTQLRLFQRDHGRYDMRKVHSHVLLDGPCGQLKNPLVHYTHQSLNQTLSNLLILMTTWEADERIKQTLSKEKSSTRWLRINLLLRPLAAFSLRYIKQGGWRDGIHGLVISLVWAMYVEITYMKIWENSLELSQKWWQQDWQEKSQDK
jgi:glycosyltransferase involved in cell wall biosynthesis